MKTLVWLRADLRVRDNPALHAACANATEGVIAVFLLAPAQWREHDMAPCRVDFTLRTLKALSVELQERNIPLLIRRADRFADAPQALLKAAREHGCGALRFSREYEINERRRDEAVQALFEREGLHVGLTSDQVFIEPGEVRTKEGGIHKVYTPFKKAVYAALEERGGVAPLGMPRKQPELVCEPETVPDVIEGYESTVDPALWPAGEKAARRRLDAFIAKRVHAYRDERDLPAIDATSALSPHLAVGSISPAQCLAAAVEANGGCFDGPSKGATHWISELVWREFYRHIMVGFQRVCMGRPFRLETERLRWAEDERGFDAWREGRTGCPIVDAAMRCLRETGWMHNRLRMITAMFLTKDLFIDWRRGERHFMQSLIDGDLASNNGGWQWSASTGTDAAPYFRIFNPISQSEKCDPDGVFIRQWVPELREVEGDAIHDPMTRLPGLLRARLEYPAPIYNHAKARERVMAAFKGLGGE